MDTFEFIEENCQFKIVNGEESINCSTTSVPLTQLLVHWEELINELTDKEIALYQWKTVYDVKANEIIEHTNFKELYGANNQKVRDNHVRNELTDWYTTIKDLEFSIDYISRRISFLRELIKVKRTILEASE